MSNKSLLKKAANVLKDADAIVITAGAGIGVDSGLPDFRGNSGFWKAYPPIAKLGLSFSSMANPQWFEEKPYLAWAFYGHRLNLYRKTIPHQGFHQLLKLGNEKPMGYFVFTSNVDGQFQKAGYADEKIEECHGSIHHFQCVEPCCNDIWDARDIKVIIDEKNFKAQEPLPQCPHCGGLARPNILMFGDWMWIDRRSNEQGIRFDNWLNEIKKANGKITIIEIGAGRSVPTVRFKSQRIAGKTNGTLIRINPREFEVLEGHIGISTGAAEGINALMNLM